MISYPNMAAEIPGPPAASRDAAMSEEDIILLESAITLLDEGGGQVWPGLGGFRCATILLTRNGQFLLNAPTAPDHFRPFGGAAPSWSAAHWRSEKTAKPDGSLFEDFELSGAVHLAYSPEQTGGRFPYPLVFLDSLARHRDKGRDTTVEGWLARLWHEFFHVFQGRGGLSKDPRPNAVTALPPEALGSYWEQISREQAVLSAALEEPKAALKAKILRRRYVPLRRARYDRLEGSGRPDLVSSELQYEAAEGTACYVEELLPRALAKLPAKNFGRLRAWPGFGGFEGFRRPPGELRRGLRQVPKTPISAASRITGLALSLALDQLSPNWKNDVFKTPGLLFAKIASV